MKPDTRGLFLPSLLLPNKNFYHLNTTALAPVNIKTIEYHSEDLYVLSDRKSISVFYKKKVLGVGVINNS
ncbi:hypothetical protein AA637_04150 [Cyanobacterium sp. HL-69]|nr:hypothetical protein AA637_04150 [Cyanobacterium sp. HL-69]